MSYWQDSVVSLCHGSRDITEVTGMKTLFQELDLPEDWEQLCRAGLQRREGKEGYDSQSFEHLAWIDLSALAGKRGHQCGATGEPWRDLQEAAGITWRICSWVARGGLGHYHPEGTPWEYQPDAGQRRAWAAFHLAPLHPSVTTWDGDNLQRAVAVASLPMSTFHPCFSLHQIYPGVTRGRGSLRNVVPRLPAWRSQEPSDTAMPSETHFLS